LKKIMPTTTVEKIKKNETSKDKKSELLLDSLEIKGYRCFEHLTIEKLGRVNLIVGKNNVGKTALLEALWIYSNQGYSRASYDALRNRDEFPFENGQTVPPENHSAIKNLFFGRPNLDYKSPDVKILIGKIQKQESKDLGDAIINSFEVEKNQIKIEGLSPDKSYGYPQLREKVGKSIKNFETFFIRTSIIENKTLVSFWDEIEKRALEDSVIKALKIIDDDLKDIRFSDYSNGSNIRIPVARLENVSERVPLKSLGEGMSHLLAIALALVKCKDGMLLIDEIESGLHYSILLDVWRLIFRTARELNVQVFAATHSSDCIKAFQRAAEEDVEDEGMLIRLARKGDKIKAILFDEKELETVVENDIEVR